MTDDVVRLLQAPSGPQWWALVMALGCHATAIVLHTLAWRTILTHEYGRSKVRWRTVLGGYAAGSAVNAFVPARAGIVLKLYVIKTAIPGATYPSVLATLGALGVFDALVTSAVVAWAIRATLLPDLGRLAHYQAFIGRVVLDHPGVAAVVAAAILALLLLGLLFRRTMYAFAVELLHGLRVLADPRYYLARVVPVQVLNWIAQLAAIGFFLAAFGLPATPQTVLVVQAAKSLAVLIPFTPSGVGAQFALLMLAFGREFPAPIVSGFAIGMRVATTSFNVALGAGALVLMLGTLRWRRAIDGLKDRRPQSRSPNAAAHPPRDAGRA